MYILIGGYPRFITGYDPVNYNITLQIELRLKKSRQMSHNKVQIIYMLVQ